MSWDPIWDDVFKGQAWGRYPEPELVRFVARNYYKVESRANIRFLELGCGPGCNLWLLAREGFSFTGIDGSPTAVAQSQERLDNECPGWRNFSEVTVGFFDTLPFDDETFDVVIDNEAISCNAINESKQAYNEAARVLKKGGKIFSRMFATETWGSGLGKAKDECTFYDIPEGPLFDRGACRFTPEELIPEIMSDFDLDPLDWLMRPLGKDRLLKEWVVTGTKSG